MTRYHRSVVVRAGLALLVLATVGAVPLSAQASGTTFGIGFGPIHAYPDEFEGGGCDGSYVGFNLGARQPLSRRVAIEGSVAWTGSTATSCALANDALSRPAPNDGDTYRRTSLAPEIPGETFWATRLGAVVSPWTAGAGLRYGFGRQTVVLDVERWSLTYDVTQETWI